MSEQFRKLGINPLTGERCVYSQRILCDLSQVGKDLILDYFGLPYNTSLDENWNSGFQCQDDWVASIASIMLPRELLYGNSPLLKFALFRAGYPYVVNIPGQGWKGLTEAEYQKIQPYYCNSKNPAEIGRNPVKCSRDNQIPASSCYVHAFTGRA